MGDPITALGDLVHDLKIPPDVPVGIQVAPSFWEDILVDADGAKRWVDRVQLQGYRFDSIPVVINPALETAEKRYRFIYPEDPDARR